MEIQWFSISMVYIMAWWLVFFIALPIGLRQPETMEAGHSTGAPEKAHLKIKAIVTTIVAIFVTWGFFIFLGSGIVTVRDVIQ